MMSVRIETLECFPRQLDFFGKKVNTGILVNHQACSGGQSTPGLIGGWYCPCECHGEVTVDDEGTEEVKLIHVSCEYKSTTHMGPYYIDKKSGVKFCQLHSGVLYEQCIIDLGNWVPQNTEPVVYEEVVSTNEEEVVPEETNPSTNGDKHHVLVEGRFKCRRCDQPISDPGGLLFSPPDEQDRVEKQHLCVKCYKLIDFVINELSENVKVTRMQKSKQPCPYCDDSDPGREVYLDGAHVRCAQNQILSVLAGGTYRKI